ncbi:hypothetical protein BZL54_08535 [Burkholderia ubonensis subsp. mesacidophila]|uniref:Uncharacterized protein n=1 Tax=Burkholderia ubonensis subsp. mesacidophila TaxID=265293 RepID=A0A2A4FK25_9BURK|nr:hypothetical protein BZL54_08535 [Burkholderia ubonensis subsp. mesacidophila]
MAGAGVAPEFEEGRRAKFAGVDSLYVGDVGGRPLDVTIENRLARYESDLVRLARALWDKTLLAGDAGQGVMKRALLGIFGYVNRGAWSVLGTSSFLSLSDQARLEYLNEQFTAAARSFAGWDFLFFKDSKTRLLICDSPLFDLRAAADRMDGMDSRCCLMPLGPRGAVVAWKSERKLPEIPVLHWFDRFDPDVLGIETRLVEGPLPDKLAEMCNTFALHRARRWIAASSENELLAHSKFLQPTEVEQRVNTDTLVVYTPASHIARSKLS